MALPPRRPRARRLRRRLRPRPGCAGPRGRCRPARGPRRSPGRSPRPGAGGASRRRRRPWPRSRSRRRLRTRPGRGVRRSAATTSSPSITTVPSVAADLDPPRVAGPGGGRGLERRRRAPEANCSSARATSSPSIACTWRAATACTRATGPRSHSSRSTVWMPWFTSAAPPSWASVPAPARGRVVLRRTVPLDACRDEEHAAEPALAQEGGEPDERGLAAVLEEDAELHPGRVGGPDEGPSARGADVDRLLDEHVPAAAGGGDALLGVERPTGCRSSRRRSARRGTPRSSRRRGRRGARPSPPPSRGRGRRTRRPRGRPRARRGRACR